MDSFVVKFAFAATLLTLLTIKVRSEEADIGFLDALERYRGYVRQPKPNNINDSLEFELSSSAGINDSIVGGKCNYEEFSKWSPISLSDDTSFADYQDQWNRMINEYFRKGPQNETAIKAQNVCFHQNFFLECDPVNKECHCATIGVWEKYKGVEIDGVCWVGKGGRCVAKDAGCVNGTKCTNIGRYYNNSHKFIFLCSDGTDDLKGSIGSNNYADKWLILMIASISKSYTIYNIGF